MTRRNVTKKRGCNMKKRNSRAVLAAVGGIALAGVMSLPAGAATSGHLVAHGASASLRFPAGVPTSKIKGEGRTAIFKPNALTVAEDTSGGNCAESSPPVSFELKNTGTATAFLTFNGSPLGSLPAGQAGTVCLFGGTAGDQATIGLSNKKDTKTFPGTLTITASD
jgi:hypothetical protein